MRVANEAEVVEMRHQNAQGTVEHSAWMGRINAQNKQKMETLASDGNNKLRKMKQHNHEDELRHTHQFDDLVVAHTADMARVEEKYQDDLAQSRKSRERNLARHNGRMLVIGMQQQHEADDMEQRHRNEVNGLSRANEEKQAACARRRRWKRRSRRPRFATL